MMKRILPYFLLIITSLLFIGPMIFTLLSSVKDNREIFKSPFSLPSIFRFENYKTAWIDASMSRNMINSLFIATLTVLVVLIVASMASYVLARYNFKFNKYLSMFFLVGMMIPMHTVMVPISYMIGKFDLKNNLFALILLYVAFSIPFSTIVLTNFMRSISRSVEEAAIIDGATPFQIYYKIILPMSGPSLATISIFNFLTAWNDVLFPLLFINDNKLKPISLGLLNFKGERASDYGPLMAAIGIAIIVPLGIYLLFQETVEEGIAAGGVKE